LVVLACAGAALLVMPPAASAKSGYYVTEPYHFETVHFRGTDGYIVSLFAFDAKHLILQAIRFRRSGVQSAAYTVPRRGSKGDQIHASLGTLGRVSLRFRASGPPEAQREPGNVCKGRAATRQKGRFVGSLEFRGEGGFTSVRATGARGEVSRSFKQVCKRLREPRGGGLGRKAVSLGAYVKGDPERAFFSVYELAHTSSLVSENVSYSASAAEQRGRMAITRSASAFAEPPTFAVSGPSVRPIAASVAPPFPFAGTATLEHGPGKALSWSGDLSADLPGRGPVALAGPSFTARLCRKDLSCVCLPGRPCAIVISGRSR
jgi:hypothetical protein